MPARTPDRWTDVPPAAVLRAGAAVIAAAIAATLGAFLLGEYEFEGLLPILTGLLFGLVIAEIVVEVGRTRALWPAAGGIAGGGIVWAGWISAGEGLEPIAGGAWLAAGLAAIVAAARVARHRPSTLLAGGSEGEQG